MNEMHSAVNTCLYQLGQMELNKIQKLRIEIQLIKVKRLMLALNWKMNERKSAKSKVLTFHAQFLESLSSVNSTETTENLLFLTTSLLDELAAMVRTSGKG